MCYCQIYVLHLAAIGCCWLSIQILLLALLIILLLMLLLLWYSYCYYRYKAKLISFAGCFFLHLNSNNLLLLFIWQGYCEQLGCGLNAIMLLGCSYFLCYWWAEQDEWTRSTRTQVGFNPSSTWSRQKTRGLGTMGCTWVGLNWPELIFSFFFSAGSACVDLQPSQPARVAPLLMTK